jgi:DNA-binding transcriptional ArsR family regulator
MMNTLAELLSSRVRAEVFRLLFASTAGELHVREIERRSGLSLSTVRQELTRLATLGLLLVRRSGNRAYYRANREHPLWPEIRGLTLKTSGLADVLRETLSGLGIQVAFVFGSVASAQEQPGSDVDLLVVGTVSLRQISPRLARAFVVLRREVNPHVVTVAEFARRRRTGEHFLTSVLRGPKLFVIGDERELAAMGR